MKLNDLLRSKNNILLAIFLSVLLGLVFPVTGWGHEADRDHDGDADGRDLMLLSGLIFAGQAFEEDIASLANVYGNTDLADDPHGSYYPPWRDVIPSETIAFDHDPAKSDQDNGTLLKAVIQGLQPGQKLEIGTGRFSIDGWFTIDLRGTEENPIWISAQSGATPVLTRPDAAQNAVNVGAKGGSRYLVLQNLEITGGNTLLKLYDCSNLWVHRCHIHHGQGVGIAAYSSDTDHLYLTENEIHATGGYAEGIYLGANDSEYISTHSIVAANHVYDCYGFQGDGIEIKQGSHSNWIVANHVHDTNYPGILAYGTDGNGINIIERNIVYRSNKSAMQVQGEAIVRNNLIMAGASAGFTSKDHQGSTRNLRVVHNTIVNIARATNLSSWNNRPGLILANNVLYSRDAESIRFPNGSDGVRISGNMVYGSVFGIDAGYDFGRGLSDFVEVTWDAVHRDATPSAGSPLVGSADPLYEVTDDIHGDVRTTELESGAFDVR